MKKIKKCFKYILFLVMILSINKVYAETAVKVNNKVAGLENVYLNKNNITLEIGSMYTLSTSVTPSNVTDVWTEWESSNPSIASVDNGNIIARKPGKVTITVTASLNDNAKISSGSKSKKATCIVTVVKSNKKLKLNGCTEVTVGKTKKITSNIIVKRWDYSNKKVKILSNKRKETNFRAKKAGTITITATSLDNKKATCKVKIVNDKIDKKVKLQNVPKQNVSKFINLGVHVPSKTLVKVKKEDSIHIGEGFCIAHYQNDIYLFAAMKDNDDKEARINVYKQNGSKFKLINKFYGKNGFFGHANDMTYNPDNKKVIIASKKGNKEFYLKNSLRGTPNFTKSYYINGNSMHSSGAIAYDNLLKKYYFASGINFFIETNNMNTIKFLKTDGNHMHRRKKRRGSSAQGIGAYKGKILVIRYNQGVKEKNSTLSKPHNAIDIYDGKTGKYLGTNIIKINNKAELEGVDYYGNGLFAIYYYMVGSGVAYARLISINLG